MMKLYVSKVEDRDQMVVILARNGYTVRQGKEKDMQPSVRERYPELALLHHIKNETKEGVKQVAVDKAMGVKKGVPDLHLPVARGGYHSLYIEMKNETGRANDAQNWWLERLKLEGNYTVVCHGWQSAVDILTWYLGLDEYHA